MQTCDKLQECFGGFPGVPSRDDCEADCRREPEQELSEACLQAATDLFACFNRLQCTELEEDACDIEEDTLDDLDCGDDGFDEIIDGDDGDVVGPEDPDACGYDCGACPDATAQQACAASQSACALAGALQPACCQDLQQTLDALCGG